MKRIIVVLAATLAIGAQKVDLAWISAERLAGKGADLTWEGPQYLQADQKGRVFLLDGRNLRVYPVVRGGLGSPEQLRSAEETGSLPPVTDAAMSPDGRDWLIRRFGAQGGLQYYRSGEERSLPEVAWEVACVGFSGSTPVVGVGVGIRDSVAGARESAVPPLLLGLSGTRWEPIVSEGYEVFAVRGAEEKRIDSDFLNALTATRESFLARGPKGALWIANRNLYRVRAFSASGRLLTDVRQGAGQVELRSRTKEEIASSKQVAAEAGAERERQWAEHILAAPSPRRAIEALAVSPSGTVFIGAASGEEGVYLDRFDPAIGNLERIGLRLADRRGRVLMAAGSDGLYLANTSGKGGRWFVAWDQLDKAEWQKVADSTITSGSDVAR